MALANIDPADAGGAITQAAERRAVDPTPPERGYVFSG